MKQPAENCLQLSRAITSRVALKTIHLGLDSARKERSELAIKALDASSALILGLLLATFVGLQLFLPLATAAKIGADEDYELSKATLVNHGYRLYSEIWNDQPPLVTVIIANLIKHASNSVLAPRLLTVGFSVLLISAAFILIRAVSGLLAATVATALFIGSPGFLELSCSVMQEILAFAPAVTALCLLWVGLRKRWRATEILAGAMFGLALQMKLIGVAYVPIFGLILWLRGMHQNPAISPSQAGTTSFRQLVLASLAFSASALLSFVALNYSTGYSLLLQLQQSWAAHFAEAKSFEYGSPDQFPFDWTVLLKNWDTAAPALVGLYLLVKQARRKPEAMLPAAWLLVTLVVFSLHKPWWPYYYIHTALPLCWCAGVGIAVGWHWIFARSPEQRTWFRVAPAGLLVLCAAGWVGARVFLEEEGIRKAPKLYASLVLKEIERFKPFAQFLFSDQPIYSFHADLPMPPHLAVISLKRLWTGEMTKARLVAELETVKPGLILLGEKSAELPFQDLLNREYRLVYHDGANRLYAHRSIANKPSVPSI